MSNLVQSTSGSSTTTSLTLTFGSATTLGNCIVLCLSGFRGGTISAITVDGTGSIFENWSSTSNDDYNAQVWFCTPVSIPYATVVITSTVAGIIGFGYELSGFVGLYNGTPPSTSFPQSWPDQSAAALASSSSWSSGATGTTLPLNEFVVGIGSTTGTASGVTITGPSSGGWTNKTAINGVHAGSYYYAAVSGYQQQSAGSGAAYTYSGTCSATSAWGAVVVTFLLMPCYANWGGYIFTEHSSYTSIAASFTVPAISGETDSIGSIWVGLGNVFQTGISLEYDTSYTGDVFCQAWSSWVGGSNILFENWSTTAYPVKSGDSLTLTLQLTNTDWIMTVANATEGWSYAEVKSVLATNIGLVEWIYPLPTAEVIIENEGHEGSSDYGPPNYGTLAFTGITTTPAISQTPQPWATAWNDIDQYPGAFSLAGSTGAFDMYWNSYS